MPYGRVLRYAAAGIYAHTLGAGANNYCVFLTQDITGAGAAVVVPRAFVTDANKLATQITITDSGVACRLDALIISAYSGIDVGPVFNGPTRTVTLGSGMYTPNGHAAAGDGIAEGNTIRAYRSLHRNVSFAVAGNATTDVIVTDHLNTIDKVAFVSPSADPVDSTAAGQLSKVFVQATALDTTTLRCVRDDAGAFGGGAAAITFDVMILARVAVGGATVAQRPMTMRPHVILATGVPSDDYAAGPGRARANSFTTADASYECLYTNVDAIAVAPGGLVLEHNLGTATKLPTGLMALIGYSVTPLTGVPYILANNTSGTQMTLAAVGAGVPVANAYVLVTRPYSVFQNESA